MGAFYFLLHNMYVCTVIYTLLGANISPIQPTFLSRWFSFSRLGGYVSSLEGINYKYTIMMYIHMYIYTRDYTRSPVVTMGWFGVGWGGVWMMTFLAHEHIFDATEMMSFLAHEHIFDATENWGGVGWGWCRSLHMNTSLMLRRTGVGWGGVGWGGVGMMTFRMNTSLMLRRRCRSLHMNTSLMLRRTGVGWGGVGWGWWRSLHMNTSLMLRRWCRSLHMNTSLMLRRWCRSKYKRIQKNSSPNTKEFKFSLLQHCTESLS